MSIEQAIAAMVKEKPRTGQFAEQLESNRKFHVRMERAGVVTRKQAFSIPLMERIAHCYGSDESDLSSDFPPAIDAVARSNF